MADQILDHTAVVENTEKALDAFDEAVDGVVDVVEVVRNNPIALVTVGVLGLVAGGVGGYFIAKKQLRSFYEELAQEEIAQAREFYAGVYKTGENGEVLSPQDVLSQRHGPQAAADALREYQGRKAAETIVSDEEMDEAQIEKIEKARIHSVSIDSEPGPGGGEIVSVEEKVVTRNVFAEPDFDLEEETKFRTEDKPYVITHDEYYAAEKEYDTRTLTYFEVDDTLVDEGDKPVDGIDKLIGDDNLARFGHGSKDRNIVFVRNDKLGMDFEIVKSTGSYLEEVLGLPNEEPNSLKHSDQRDRRRAFRHGDG